MPIINPIYFYLMEVGNGIKFLLFTFSLILLIGIAISAYVWYEEVEYGGTEEELELRLKVVKKFVISTIACILFSIFIPSSDTITKMIVAENITVENYEIAKGEITELIDYIADKFEQK